MIIYWEGTDGNSKELTVNLSYAVFESTVKLTFILKDGILGLRNPVLQSAVPV